MLARTRRRRGRRDDHRCAASRRVAARTRRARDWRIGAPVNALRFGVAFALLVVPATAMGATLPVLVGALCQAGDRFGTALGRLYGWNTLGAVAGVLGSELVLIESPVFAAVRGRPRRSTCVRLASP